MFTLKMKKALLFVSGAVALLACTSEKTDERANLANNIEKSITTELLNKWYPAAMDKQYGGFLSTWTFDFKPTGEQDKMIVSQSRHVWTNSKASEVYKDVAHYKECATHGFRFLKDVMWDKTYGGFYTLVDRQGNVKSNRERRKNCLRKFLRDFCFSGLLSRHRRHECLEARARWIHVA